MTVHETTSQERAETLRQRAAELGPEFEAASAQAETERTLPSHIAEKMKEAGFFWMKTPLELGGSELDPVSFSTVMEEIAYHDASAAWAAMIGSGTTGTVSGWFSDEGVQEIFAAGEPLPVVAGQFTPRGTAVPVEGGYRISGRWGFGSGIDHSNWVIGGCMVEGADEPIFAAVPKEQVTVHGNWNAVALQGTGSHDFSIEDVFVPASRTMGAYGGTSQRGGALFRQPIMIFISNEISPLVVGIARRAIDDLIDLADGTIRSASGPLADRVAFQKAIGQAEAKWQAARSLYLSAAAEGYGLVSNEEAISEDRVAELRARHTLTAELCAELVQELFRYGGGRVLSANSPLQRHLRNLLGALQHVFLSEENYELSGQAVIRRRAVERG